MSTRWRTWSALRKPVSRPGRCCSLNAVEEGVPDAGCEAGQSWSGIATPPPTAGDSRLGLPSGARGRSGAGAARPEWAGGPARVRGTGHAASAALAREALRMPALVLGVAPGLLGEPRGLGALPGAFLAGQPLLLGLGPGAGASPPRRVCLVRAAADARGPRAAHLDPRQRPPRSRAPAALPAPAAAGPRRGTARGGVSPSPAARFPPARWCLAVPARSCCRCCCSSLAPRRGLRRSVPSRLSPVRLAGEATPRTWARGSALGGLGRGRGAALGTPRLSPELHRGPGAWAGPAAPSGRKPRSAGDRAPRDDRGLEEGVPGMCETPGFGGAPPWSSWSPREGGDCPRPPAPNIQISN